MYRLVLNRSGRPGALEPLPVPPVAASINGFALSPDGSRLALSLNPPSAPAHGLPPRNAKLMVVNLATGAERTWEMSGIGWIGQHKPSDESLSWASDNRTLLFKEYRGEGGVTAQIRLLDTAAAGGSLAAASKLVPFSAGEITAGGDAVSASGNMFAVSGARIITVVATGLYRGRPGFPSGRSFNARVRSLLPKQCHGSDHHMAKKTPYCTRELLQVLRRVNEQVQAASRTDLAFTEFSAATAKPVAVLGTLHGEGTGLTQAEVSWVSPSGSAMIIDGTWPAQGGSWPGLRGGGPAPVAGVLTGGTFTPFPRRVQALYFGGQPTW
jgi:hypothetical protein